MTNATQTQPAAVEAQPCAHWRFVLPGSGTVGEAICKDCGATIPLHVAINTLQSRVERLESMARGC